jgi:hypothetical protein
MKNVKPTEKQKVISRLVKWGHNEENATSWVNEHYEYASTYYSGVSKIAEVISSL